MKLDLKLVAGGVPAAAHVRSGHDGHAAAGSARTRVAVSVAGYELDGAARGVVVQPDEVCHLGGGAGDWEPVRGPVARPVCGPVVLRTSGAGRATNICPRRQ